MSEDVLFPIVVAALLVAVAAVARSAIRAASRGSAEPGVAAGFRTGATKSSREAWAEGHRAGQRWMDNGAATSIVCALVAPLALLLPSGERVVEASLLLSAGSLLVGTVGGGVVAHRAARQVQRAQDSR